MPRGSEALAKDKKGMFNFNSGKEQRTFPAYNPYTISRCATCDKTKLNLAYSPDNQICSVCVMEQQCILRKSANEIKTIAKSTLQGGYINNPDFPHKVFVSGRSIKEWLNQPHKNYDAKYHLLLEMKDVFKTSKYLGTSFYKEQPAHIFEISLCGDKTWIVVKEYPDGYTLHSISDNSNILINIKQTP